MTNSLQKKLLDADYIIQQDLALVVEMAGKLPRPLLMEGPAGVGKTALASALAQVKNVNLIRLQCYEGLDASQALYDWDYPKQLLTVRTTFSDNKDTEGELYSESFLIERPLLQALREKPAPVLLIDEIDRADEEFEALLLEFLSEFQLTIPELGTYRATEPPIVILTSNRTRDLSDALRRRCLYIWLDYPMLEHEMAIISLHVPEIAPKLAEQVAHTVRRLRELPLLKHPGLAESIDFSHILTKLNVENLHADIVSPLLGSLLKTKEDIDVVRERGLEFLWN